MKSSSCGCSRSSSVSGTRSQISVPSGCSCRMWRQPKRNGSIGLSAGNATRVLVVAMPYLRFARNARLRALNGMLPRLASGCRRWGGECGDQASEGVVEPGDGCAVEVGPLVEVDFVGGGFDLFAHVVACSGWLE